ncbi:MAG TPA: serine/threonine-protein kinase [Gemmatimonadaceae bacterium]|nr:serine/threonine-protein kinase [Gemmatimonadaceae bacterium]
MKETSIEWDRVKQLFAATFEADHQTRHNALHSESDERIRRKVESMLSAHDAMNGPLDKSVLLSVESLDVSLISRTPALTGRMLGPYRVVREIGRGGMGAVYEAVRADSQFDQRVAIKTLRTGADSDAVLKRFQQERQILAALQHPNIATLYDGAITDEGLPYFVLEFVNGVPIDVYCREQKVGIRERIELFLQVISAVQYAHQQLVVHRDIKPGNILVTPDGVVKLVDFGIAKLLDTSRTEVTGDLFAPLTVSYASPEQVTGAPITAASDVYSLGVVLYRLIVGVKPLELDDVSLERAITTLSTVLPQLPSDSASADAAESMRIESAEKLGGTLRGDLDAILMTALRKEPERRYATARQFGDDLSNYLKGLPVAAVRDTISYRLGKFVRRQRALVAVTVVAVLAIVAGGASTLWQAREARLEADRARSVSEFLQSVIGAGDLSSSANSPRLGPAASVSQLLDSAASRLPHEIANDPSARVDIHLALGRAFVTQQRWHAAKVQFEFARRISEELPRQPRVETARALAGLASIAVLSGGPLPKDLTQRAIAILERRGAQSTADYAGLLRLSGILDVLEGRYASADTLLGRSISVYASLSKAPSTEKASALVDHTAVGEALGRPWAASLANYRHALAMIDSIPGDVADKADILWYAARAEGIAGNQPKADSLGMEALRVLERASGPHSGSVAQQLAQLASIKRERGDTATAGEFIERAMDIIRGDKEVPGLIRERVLMEYARHQLAKGRIKEAESLADEVYRSRLAAGNWVYILDGDNLYTDILMRERKLDEAEPVLRTAFDMSTRYHSASYRSLFARRLIDIYYKTKRPQLAARYLPLFPDSVQKQLRSQ